MLQKKAGKTTSTANIFSKDGKTHSERPSLAVRLTLFYTIKDGLLHLYRIHVNMANMQNSSRIQKISINNCGISRTNRYKKVRDKRNTISRTLICQSFTDYTFFSFIFCTYASITATAVIFTTSRTEHSKSVKWTGLLSPICIGPIISVSGSIACNSL